MVLPANLTYDTVLLFWRIVANLFFREIRPRGAWNIPRDSPIIFVAAPHHNQVWTNAASCMIFVLNEL
jgi:glycerol-3-phosphate O-acyltransferase/dihydroxyacetone phosphate acyltransferase